jgi:hypothetical protein
MGKIEIDETELHRLKDKANLWDSMTDRDCFISFYTGSDCVGGALRQTLRVPGKHYDSRVERKANKMARELGACSWWVFKPIGMPTNVYYGQYGEESRLERLEIDNG